MDSQGPTNMMQHLSGLLEAFSLATSIELQQTKHSNEEIRVKLSLKSGAKVEGAENTFRDEAQIDKE